MLIRRKKCFLEARRCLSVKWIKPSIAFNLQHIGYKTGVIETDDQCQPPSLSWLRTGLPRVMAMLDICIISHVTRAGDVKLPPTKTMRNSLSSHSDSKSCLGPKSKQGVATKYLRDEIRYLAGLLWKQTLNFNF